MVSLQGLGLALIIDGLHAEHVLLAFLQPGDVHVGVLVIREDSIIYLSYFLTTKEAI